MGFDLATVKQRVKESFEAMNVKVRVRHDRLYGLLCAAAFAPLAEAAIGGDAVALGKAALLLAGSVGANLLANIRQQKKDAMTQAADPKLWTELARDPDAGPVIQTYIEETGAVEAARDAMDESDRAWFTETLRRELRELGRGYHVTVHGDKNITQIGDGINVLASRGSVVVGGKQAGNINTGFQFKLGRKK